MAQGIKLGDKTVNPAMNVVLTNNHLFSEMANFTTFFFNSRKSCTERSGQEIKNVLLQKMAYHSQWRVYGKTRLGPRIMHVK